MRTSRWSRSVTKVAAPFVLLASVAVVAGFGPTSLSAFTQAGPTAQDPAASAAPACSPAQLVIGTVADRAVYRQSADVKITSTARNASPWPCRLVEGADEGSGRYCAPSPEVMNASGRIVWAPGVYRPAACVVRYGLVSPGESRTVLWHWDHSTCDELEPSCEGEPVSPGTYRAVARWSEGTGVSTAFEILLK